MRKAAVALLLLSSFEAAAQEPVDPGCSARFGSRTRGYRSCVDERNRPAFPPAPQRSTRWTAGESIDRLDDTKTTSVTVETNKVEIWNSQNVGRDRAFLAVRCVGSTMVVVLGFGPADNTKVQRGRTTPRAAYRIDKNTAVRGGWTTAGEDGDMRIAHPDEAIQFARSLKDAKALFVRVENDAGVIAEVDFAVDGFEAASEPLRAACPWRW